MIFTAKLKKHAEGFIRKLKYFIKRMRLEKHVAAITCSVVCLAVLASILILNTQMGYAVYMNGEELGEAKSLDDVESAVADAECKLSELLGYEYDLTDSISVETKVVKSEDTGELKEAILDEVSDVTKCAVIKVNDVVVGALPTEDDANALLNDILNVFMTDGITDVQFKENVTVSLDFVTDSVPNTYSVIYSLLDPYNAYSDSSLTVISTGIRMTEETIPYETEYRTDSSLPADSVNVITAGVNGTKVISEKYELINGVEISSSVVGEIVAVQPVTEICIRGSSEEESCKSKGIYIWPAKGELTSFFGYRDDVEIGSNNHRGLDIADCCGSDIIAADGGTVIFAGYLDSYGNTVKIQHDNGDVTWYCHLNDYIVSEGESVAQGELIAYMGSTGDSTGDHLHFEIHPGGGSAVDPLCYLPW